MNARGTTLAAEIGSESISSALLENQFSSQNPAPQEVQNFYHLAQACSLCRNEQDFITLSRSAARALLPHTALIAALGRVDLDHLEILHLIAVDYPTAGILALRRASHIRERPALMRWLKGRQPLILDVDSDAGKMSELESSEIANLGLGRVAAHGVVDITSRSGSYLSFCGVPTDLPRDAIETRLRLMVPHLHQALINCHNDKHFSCKPKHLLTSTERELMRYVAAGRTNAEIAVVRGRSESTVRNQLTVAFRKLGVRNRAEAVRAELLLNL